jgi:hypothetical protein
MWNLCRLIWWVIGDLFRPRARLEAEVLVLRQQINVLRRSAPKRLLLSGIDRLIFIGLFRLVPDVRGALTIVKPDTVTWRGGGARRPRVGGLFCAIMPAGSSRWIVQAAGRILCRPILGGLHHQYGRT